VIYNRIFETKTLIIPKNVSEINIKCIYIYICIYVYRLFLSKPQVSMVLLNPNVFLRAFKKNVILMNTPTSEYIFLKLPDHQIIESSAVKIRYSYYIIVITYKYSYYTLF